jgi:hypothetical protein
MTQTSLNFDARALTAPVPRLKISNPEIAEIIAQQMGGINRMVAMTGAHTFVDMGNGLSFKFKGCRKANCLQVILDSSDTYSLTFCKITQRGLEVETKLELSGVYADQLRGIFESYTGLYLSI